MSNLMMSFFQLGDVLIATSNRMPEDLAKAMGAKFPWPPSRLESLGWRFVMRGVGNLHAQHGEFAAFSEVLEAHCETWRWRVVKIIEGLISKEMKELKPTIQEIRQASCPI
jgi:peroxisome-assembly ATPase